MSTRLIVTGLGTAVGAWFGQPALGYTIGSTLGALLDPAELEDLEGPKLGDLTVQSSTYGQPVPVLYGTRIVAGQVIWKTDIKETRHEQDVDAGKGGGQSQTQITYTYSVSFAVGLCQGEIDGIKRVFADGKVIYDFGTDNTFTIINQMEAEQRRGDLTIYTGTETQVADPVIESFEGSGNVPGFRGLAYIVFDDLQLQDFGNRVPNITVEVVNNGTLSYKTATIEDAFGPLSGADPNYHPVEGRGYVYRGLVELLCNGFNYPDARLKTFDWDGNLVDDIQAPAGTAAAVEGASGMQAILQPVNNVYTNVAYRQSFCGATNILIGNTGECTEPGTATISIPTAVSPYTSYAYSGFVVGARGDDYYLFWTRLIGGTTQNRQMRVVKNATTSVYNVNVTNVVDHAFEKSPGTYENAGQGNAGISFESNGVDVWLCYVSAAGYLEHHTWDGQGNFTKQASWNDFGFSEPFGDQSWQVADNGVCMAGGTTSSDIFIATRIQTVTDDPVTVASIVEDLCTRSGLAVSDIDTSTLTDEVFGFSVARPSSARSNLKTLQKVGYFDIVETDWQLVFKKRGTAPVRTLDTDDMSADFDKPDLNQQINTTRTQEKDLPKVVKVQYLSKPRDQQPSEQSVRRIITQATAEISERLPVVMEDDKARQVAEVILHSAWEARDRHDISVSVKHIELEPGDVINFAPLPGDTLQARIVATTYQNGKYEVSMVSENIDTYISDQVGEEIEVREQVIPILGPAEIYILDLPLMRDGHNINGMYIGGRGLFPNWPGAQLFQSLDEEVTWDPVFPLSDAIIVGRLLEPLAEAREETWDRGNTLRVKLSDVSQTLSSTTELNALNGTANIALVGNHSRWEVISFVNATLEDTAVYELDTFIRGRKGTGRNIGTSVLDDLFIVLDESLIERAYVSLDRIQTVRPYRAVTFGQFISEAETFYQQYTAEAHRPFPVGDLRAQLRSDAQLNVSWRNSYIYQGEWNDLLETPNDGTVGSTSVRVYDNDTGDQLRLATVYPGYESTSFTNLNGGVIPAHAASGRKYTFGDSDQYLLIQRPNYTSNTEDAGALIINIDTGGILGVNSFIWGFANYLALGDFIYYETDCCIYALDYTNNPQNYPAFDTNLSASDYVVLKSDAGVEYGSLCVAGDELWGIHLGLDEIVKVNPDLTVNTRYSGVPSGLVGMGHMDGNATHIFVVAADLSTYYIYNKAGDSWAGPYTYTLTDNNSPIYQMYVNPNGAVFKSLSIGAQGDTGMRMVTNTNSVIFDEVEVLLATTGYIGLGVSAASFTAAGFPDQTLADGQQFAVPYVDPTTNESVYRFINTATGAVVEDYSRGGYTTEYCQFVYDWNTTVCYPWTFQPKFFWGAQGISPASGNEWLAWAQTNSHAQITGNFLETVEGSTFEATGGAATLPPLRVTVQVNPSTTGAQPSDEVEIIIND